mmetsp:Transcript_39722/g.78097  ORF Transcript_39722/g.78097 Transcript_39722/m.78097 type:complete len:244 (-) Transcript_39722:70-801(-)
MLLDFLLPFLAGCSFAPLFSFLLDIISLPVCFLPGHLRSPDHFGVIRRGRRDGHLVICFGRVCDVDLARISAGCDHVRVWILFFCFFDLNKACGSIITRITLAPLLCLLVDVIPLAIRLLACNTSLSDNLGVVRCSGRDAHLVIRFFRCGDINFTRVHFFDLQQGGSSLIACGSLAPLSSLLVNVFPLSLSFLACYLGLLDNFGIVRCSGRNADLVVGFFRIRGIDLTWVIYCATRIFKFTEG